MKSFDALTQSVEQCCQAASALYARNRFADAFAILAPLLESRPANPEALNLAAVCALQMKRTTDAEAIFRRAIEENPHHADAHHNLGTLLWDLGRTTEAEAAYRQAIALRPAFTDACRNLANLLDTLGRPDDAHLIWQQLATQQPDDAEAHYRLGLALKKLGRPAEAEDAYRRAIALHPDDADAHNSLGILLGELDRQAEAREALQRAIDLRPDYADAHNNLGVLFKSMHCAAHAEASYRRAIAFRPDHAEAWNNLGVLLHELKRSNEAADAYRLAIDARPTYDEACNNLGIVLWEQKRFDEAEAAYRRALDIDPNYVGAWNNLGVLLYDLDRLDEAEAAYRRALTIDPSSADLQYNFSHLLLGVGQFDEGWRHYRSRDDSSRTRRSTTPPDTTCPEWRGEPLQGKSVLVWHEQGFGDMIQFGRYLPMLKARGAACVTLACPTALLRLFATADGVDVATDSLSAARGDHDFWVYPMSLPLCFGTTLDSIPPATYLRADPALVARWRERLASCDGRRIGIMWQGNPSHRNDHNRSLPSLATLAPLWSMPGTSFVSLQKGEADSEARAATLGQPLLSLGAELEDFGDTAAVMAQLDLVICVDSAVAHLAGSLGVPCWVLLSAMQTDWRWMKARADSPWYPHTTRLFRQTTPAQDWASVVERLREACGREFPAAGRRAD